MTSRLFATVLLPGLFQTIALSAEPAPLVDGQDPPPDPLITEASLVRVGKPAQSGAHTIFGMPCSLALDLKAGYDSNVLLAAQDNSDVASNAKSMALGAVLRGSLTLLDNEKGGLLVGGDTGYVAYPSVHEADLARLSGYTTGFLRFGPTTLGANLGAARYESTSPEFDRAADVAYVTMFLSREFRSNVLLGSAGLTNLTLDDHDPSSGVRFDLSPRWWYLLEDEQTNRRIELNLRYARLSAQTDDRSYQSGTVGLGAVYRFGESQSDGATDVEAHLDHEWRIYDQSRDVPVREQHRLLSLNLNVDHWLTEWASVGPYVGIERREGSPSEVVDYNRWQLGVRSSFIY